MSRFLHVVIRFAFVAILEAFSLVVVDWLVPGIALAGSGSVSLVAAAISTTLVLGVINAAIRPFLVLLTLRLNVLTLGFFTLVINAAMLLLSARFLPYFAVDGWGAALWATLVLAAVNTLLTSLTTIDDNYSFFDGLAQWLVDRQRVGVDNGQRARVAQPQATDVGRGLLILQIDGLSYPRVQRAIEQGLLPTVRRMMDRGTHVLSHYDCGLPSQTSSCQAGIMYGDNFDIPAFRWYDKDRGEMFVSNRLDDVAELAARYARGHGLLRGGSSINNLMAGDAKKTLLTVSVLAGEPKNVERYSLEDLYLLWLNPYVFTRSIVLALWDVLVELGQGIRQRLRGIRPRVSRLHKAYPFRRAIANVFLRDLSTYMVMIDVIRGVPAIYTTYIGYDEIAHHAGPSTPDAMNSLRSLDTQLRRILEVVERKAPRPYDVILLSDHGQSVGATFKQRYGYTLAEFIEDLVQEKVTVTDVNAAESGQEHTMTLLADMQSVEQRVGGRLGEATVGRARKALQNRLERALPPAIMDAQVIVCASGNLANVYFDLHAGKVNVRELSQAYPGLVDALVAHPGVGFVVAYAEDGTPWILGQSGVRNLRTGAVTGSDPLLPYGDPARRAAQLLRLAQFPHAGDLIVNSTIYADGQVAAFEELVGSHGGLGGQQTDAFLLHPADMMVPPISNAADMFALLDARRGLPGESLSPRSTATKVDSWTLAGWLDGLRDARTWVARAARALRLNRDAFREVAEDPSATGPALVVLLGAFFISSLAVDLNPEASTIRLLDVVSEFIGGLVGWGSMVFLTYVVGRLLKGLGTSSTGAEAYTRYPAAGSGQTPSHEEGRGALARTMRALAFAQMLQIVGLLRLLPAVGGLFPAVTAVMEVLATWIALRQALRLPKPVAAPLSVLGWSGFAITYSIVVLLFRGITPSPQAILAHLAFTLGL